MSLSFAYYLRTTVLLAFAACLILSVNADSLPAQGQEATNLIRQSQAQDLGSTSPFNEKLLDGVEPTGMYNDTYLGVKKFWNDDIAGDFFANIGQVLGRW